MCFPWIPEPSCINHYSFNLLFSCKQLVFSVSADWCHGYQEAFLFFPELGSSSVHLSHLPVYPPYPFPGQPLPHTPMSFSSTVPKRKLILHRTSLGSQALLQLPELKLLAFIAHSLLSSLQAGLTVDTDHHYPASCQIQWTFFIFYLPWLLCQMRHVLSWNSVPLDFRMLASPSSSPTFWLGRPRVLSSSSHCRLVPGWFHIFLGFQLPPIHW